MSKLIKRIQVLGVSLLIGLTIFSGGVANIVAEGNQSRAGNNVTALVSIDDVSMYIELGGTIYPIIENGVEVEGHPDVTVGNAMLLRYKWSVADATTLVEGDYFEIGLPTGFVDYINSDESPLIDDNGVEIGTWKILNGKIVAVFNENVEDKLSIEDGYFSVAGRVSNSGEDIELETGGIILPPITIEPEPEENLQEFPDYGNIFKLGSQVLGENRIVWDIRVNYDNYKKVYAGETPDQMNDVIVEDTLNDEMLFVESKLEIAHTMYLTTEDGKMSAIPVSYMNIISAFQKLEQLEGESYTAFKTRIENSSVPAYGIFSRKNLVINFKNLPNGGSGIKNPNLANDTALYNYLTTLVDNGTIQSSQRDSMFQAYSSTNTANGDLIGFQIIAPVDVIGTTGEYTNTVKLKYNNTETNTSEKRVDFIEMSGGANTTDPGTLSVAKVDDNNERLEGVSFKLEKKNGLGIYEDYNALDGVGLIRETNAAGKVVFSKLEYGEYRLVEVAGLPGYKDEATFLQSEYFTIDNSQVKGIDIEVINHLKEGAVELVKKNTSDMPLVGAQFKLYKTEGAITSYYTGVDIDGLATWTTLKEDAKVFITPTDGKIEATGLPIGSYYFVETKAPTGYVIDTTPIKLDVTKENILSETNASEEMVNYLLGSVTLSKVDEITNIGLEGAEFTLFDKNGTPIYTNLKTDINGNITVNGLAAGDYYFVETRAPEDYVLDASTVSFMIVEKVETTVLVTKTNTKKIVTLDSKDTKVNTSDTTNISLLLGIFALSAFVVLRKARRK